MKVFLLIGVIFTTIFLTIILSLIFCDDNISIPKLKISVNARSMRRKTERETKNDIKVERKDLKEEIRDSVFTYYTEAHIYYPENIKWLEKKGFKVTFVKYDNVTDYYRISWE